MGKHHKAYGVASPRAGQRSACAVQRGTATAGNAHRATGWAIDGERRHWVQAGWYGVRQAPGRRQKFGVVLRRYAARGGIGNPIP